MPQRQAAQENISVVVPVNLPWTRRTLFAQAAQYRSVAAGPQEYEPSPTVWLAVELSGRGSQLLRLIELAQVLAARGNVLRRRQLVSALLTQLRDGPVWK
jgi:hypothetical protein